MFQKQMVSERNRMNHQLRIRSTGDFYQRLFEVGVTELTLSGTSRRFFEDRRGLSISLFTLDNVVLALFAGFFVFCIVKYSQGSFGESVLNSSSGRRAMVQGGDPICASCFWIGSKKAFFSDSSTLSSSAPKDAFCHSV
jgi:hypothetical protein